MSEGNNTSMRLIFTKTTSKSEAAKITEFWKFIDSQNDIKPYTVEKTSEDPNSLENKDKKVASEKEDSDENDGYKKLLLLDKVACSTSKYKNAFKKKNDNLILSDMVEQTYEEINDELKKFETRLKNK